MAQLKTIYMTINSIRVILPKQEPANYAARVQVTVDGGVILRGMALMHSNDSMFLLMPYIFRANRSRLDIFHPISQEIRKQLTDEVISVYQQAVHQKRRDLTVIFNADGKTSFGNIGVRRLSRFHALKGTASVVLNNAIFVNRISIVKDPVSGILRLEMPYQEFERFGSREAYIRFPAEDYEELYKLIISHYSEKT